MTEKHREQDSAASKLIRNNSLPLRVVNSLIPLISYPCSWFSIVSMMVFRLKYVRVCLWFGWIVNHSLGMNTRPRGVNVFHFYTPVWKTGRIMPWQCPSVRLSVRPSVRVFRTFLQHALRYQFETWYIHSVGGTTCQVWVASQLGHFDLVYSQK